MTTHPVHLILSAGTRIVTRNEASRIGGGQLIATGADVDRRGIYLPPAELHWSLYGVPTLAMP